MKVIAYQIKLLEPVLVTSLDGDPNSATTFDFLPGSVLRGVIISRFIQHQHQHQHQQNKQYLFDADNDYEQRLFFNGTTRYLNGYPLDRLNNRCLPTPLSWKQDKNEVAKRQKDNPAPIFDYACDDSTDEVEQEQNIQSLFCWLSPDNQVRLINPLRQLAVHTARTRRFGRAMPAERIRDDEDPGAVYRYEAIAPGQIFESMILCDHDRDVEFLKTLLDGEAVIGGSRSGGYGRVKFEAVRTLQTNWREVGRSLAYHSGDTLVITLLSDTLLRDNNGQFSTDGNIVEATVKKQLSCELKLIQSFVRSRIVGGFNRKWGLPLTQTVAAQMGSTYIFAPSNCAQQKLLELENSGIGERRAEGFGRVAINWNVEEQLTIDSTPHEKKTSASSLSPTSRELAQRMAERLLRRQLDSQIIVRANELTSRLQEKREKLPHCSQLSRLRQRIHDALLQTEPQTQGIGEFLDNVKKHHITRRQFEQVELDGQTLLNWLDEKQQIVNQEKWKKLLKLEQQGYLRSVAGIAPKLTDRLRNEYLLRLIDAVLARMAKLKRE